MADIENIVVGAQQHDYTFSRDNVKESDRGSITLNKTGLNSKDIAGFTLYNSSGAAVGGEKRITGNGSVSWTNLPYDTYKIVETTVPAGYSKMADIKGIVVSSAQKNFSFSKTNKKTVTVYGSITLNKSGLSSTDVAGFTLYNSAGAAIGGERRITGNGSVTWSNLSFDTYRIVETTVPPGYSQMADITGIVVSNSQRSHSFNRVNTGGGVEVLGIMELPFTGMNPIIPISGLLSIIAGFALLMISIFKRNRGKKKSEDQNEGWVFKILD